MTVKFNGGGTLIFPNTLVDLPKTRRFFRETGCLRVIITTLKAPHYQWSLRGLISQDDDQLYQLLGSSNFWTELWFSHWKLFASFMTSEAIAMYSSGSEWIADSRLNSYLNLVELLQIEGIRYLQIHLMFPHFPHHFPTFSHLSPMIPIIFLHIWRTIQRLCPEIWSGGTDAAPTLPLPCSAPGVWRTDGASMAG